MKEENNKSYEVIAEPLDLSRVNKGYVILKGSGNPEDSHEIIGVMLDDGTEIGTIEQITKVEEHELILEPGPHVVVKDVTSKKLLHTGELLF